MTKIRMPTGLPAPVHPIMTQFKVEPGDVYQTVKACDYVVPSFMPLFAMRESTRPLKAMTSRKRKADTNAVRSVVANMCTDRVVPGCRFEFVGVAYDGVYDGQGARAHPDAIARFSGIVSGLTPILCAPEDLERLEVGQCVGWIAEPSRVRYTGLPSEFASFRLVPVPEIPLGLSAGRTAYEFGPRQPFVFGTNKDELLHRLTFILSHVRGSPVEEAGYDGVLPRNQARAIANLVLRAKGIKLRDEHDWENVLYSPASPYFIMEHKPETSTSPKWMQDCLGDVTGPVCVEQKPGGSFELCATGSKTGSFLPQSLGWLREFLRTTGKPYDGFRGTASATEALQTPLSKTEQFMFVMGKPMDQANGEDLTDFLEICGSATHCRVPWLRYLKAGVMKTIPFVPATFTPNTNQTTATMQALAKTQFDFSQLEQAEAATLLTELQSFRIRTAVTKPNYKTWLESKRADAISDTVQQSQRIGRVIAKGESHATVLMQ